MADDTVNLHELVGGLSEAQQAELYSQLAYKVAQKGKREAELSRDEAAIWHVLCEVCRTTRRPIGPFLVSFGSAKYKAAVAKLMEFVDFGAGASGELTHHQRLAVARISLECVAKQLRRRRIWSAEDGCYIDAPIMVTPSTLLRRLDYLQQAIDACYPGYVAAGLLLRVVARAA